jgi:CRISPR/Cas system CSM-associated protein Csm3 (group 7 of RAMP superfamily)
MRQFKPEPKPFDFVTFEKSPQREAKVEHSKLDVKKLTGKMTCCITALSPIHVGSGLFDLKGNKVFKSFVKSIGEFIIPGSSLKGVFRSIVETISASCVNKANPNIYKNVAQEELDECSNPNKLCPACRIFGAKNYLGRVRISDASMVSGSLFLCKIPPLFSPRQQVRAYLNSEGKYKGRKFYFHGKLSYGRELVETVKEGAIFKFTASFDNLTRDELCLLFTGMGIIGELKPKIGGGKPACLGSVEVSLDELVLMNPIASFENFTISEEKLTGDNLQNFLRGVSKQNSLILEDSFARLRKILTYPSQKPCPSRAY